MSKQSCAKSEGVSHRTEADEGEESGMHHRRVRTESTLDPDESECTTDSKGGSGEGSAQERRTFQRVELEVDLGFGSESTFYTGLTMDVSTGGVFVATYTLLPIGTLVQLEFELPEGHRVKAAGQVRWLRESRMGDQVPGMGISFDVLASHDLLAIETFCQVHAPLYYDVE